MFSFVCSVLNIPQCFLLSYQTLPNKVFLSCFHPKKFSTIMFYTYPQCFLVLFYRYPKCFPLPFSEHPTMFPAVLFYIFPQSFPVLSYTSPQCFLLSCPTLPNKVFLSCFHPNRFSTILFYSYPQYFQSCFEDPHKVFLCPVLNFP